MRIDEDQRAPTIEHELVDGVKRAVAELLRVHQQQNIHVIRDPAYVGLDGLHFEEPVHLLHRDPGTLSGQLR